MAISLISLYLIWESNIYVPLPYKYHLVLLCSHPDVAQLKKGFLYAILWKIRAQMSGWLSEYRQIAWP